MGVIHGGNVIEGAAERLRTATVALAAATGAGGILAWQNPEDRPIIVTRIVLDVTTKSTGAATADFGPAANATTSSDTLLDGVDVGTAAGVFDNIENQGTNGKSTARLDENGGTTDYITGSGVADPAGLVGNAYIWYVVV